MAGISATGIGSGLDIESLVSQLMTLEQRPLTLLNTKEASYQASLSAFGQIKSALSTLESTAKNLNSAAKFASTKASVADTTLLSATTGAFATAGSYSVDVQAIAKTQRTATSATTEYSPVAGDLTITFGSISGGIFTPGSDPTKTLSFAGGSIEALRDAINDGDLGVTASVIHNGTVNQLVLTSNGTGADQAFSIGGTIGLSYDPASTTTNADPIYGVQSAQNALISVDGIAVSRATNTIEDVIKGVTLTLTKADPGNPTTVTVSSDKTSVRSSLDALIKAYNDFNSTIKSLTAYDADTETAAALTGDATARSIQSQVRRFFGSTLTDFTGVTSLSSLGITFQSDGSLSADSAKLNAALNDSTKDVAGFFTGKDGVTGFAKGLADLLDQFTLSTGVIVSKTDGINASIKTLDKQREVISTHLTLIEARYRKQFTALDSLISSYNQTSTYLTQQLANLPKLNSNN